MTTVTSSTIHRYKIINDITIEYGATPDRHVSDVLINCVPIQGERVKDTGEGLAFDFSAPVRVEVFVRDNEARAKREEPQQLKRLKKELIQFLNLNKHSLMDDGISHITIGNVTMRAIDKEEHGLSNWYRMDITVHLQYRLKYVSV